MDEMRLGDVIDDHCVKCRRITNHSIVSLVNGEAAKVRCRTCYHDHDYRHEQPPPSKKELKKAEADAQAAAALFRLARKKILKRRQNAPESDAGRDIPCLTYGFKSQ
jgi:hypothetical protein